MDDSDDPVDFKGWRGRWAKRSIARSDEISELPGSGLEELDAGETVPS